MSSHTEHIQYKLKDLADSIATRLHSAIFQRETIDILKLVNIEIRNISAIIQLVDYLLLNEMEEQKFVDEVKKLFGLDKNTSTHKLQKEIQELHWMAHRYVDGRATYAVSVFNSITRALIREGILLESVGKDQLFARDQFGPAYE
jgi:hypothetical protein